MEKVSICICTRNRVEDLKKAIESVYQSSYSNYEIIVSDDSTNNESMILVKSNFPKVKYVIGPQKGLCFNRNNALKFVKGTRVLFMDDDVIMSKDFLEVTFKRLYEINKVETNNIIITGIERNRGCLVYPNNIDFLGYQTRSYRPGESLKTIVINSTMFPTSLFKLIKFDEQLVYGYDEVDFAARSVSKGYKISLCKEAINDHFPSEINREYYSAYKDASRIYVTFKRYSEIEKRQLKSFMYLCISFMHLLVKQFTKNFSSLNTTFGIMNKAISYIKLSKLKTSS